MCPARALGRFVLFCAVGALGAALPVAGCHCGGGQGTRCDGNEDCDPGLYCEPASLRCTPIGGDAGPDGGGGVSDAGDASGKMIDEDFTPDDSGTGDASDAAGTTDGGTGAPDSGGCVALDSDGDGFDACTGDCAEGDPLTFPGAPENCGDGVTNDCLSGLPPDTGCAALGTYVAPPPVGADGAAGTQAAPVDDINDGMAHSLLIEAMGGPADLPVYVAAAAGGPGLYDEDVTMVEGISLLGGYESAGWTRDPASNVTIINPLASEGVVAPATVSAATVLEGFTINAMRTTLPAAPTSALHIDGGSPTIRGNVVNAVATPGSDVAIDITGTGFAVPPAPIITRNVVNAGGGGGAYSAGIGGSDHAAQITGNLINMAGATYSAGIACSGCDNPYLLFGNTIDGSMIVADGATGIEMEASSGAVDSNFVYPGICVMASPGCRGLRVTDDSVVVNNVIYGGLGPDTAGIALYASASSGVGGFLPDDIHHNYVNGGGLSSPVAGGVSAALALDGAPGGAAAVATVHSNVLHAGFGLTRYGVRELAANVDPVDVLNNDFRVVGVSGTGVYYLDEGSTSVTSIGGVNLLADVPATMNIDGDCAFVSELWGGDFHLTAASLCVDAGAPSGGPAYDFEGDVRPAGTAPDIGPDEF